MLNNFRFQDPLFLSLLILIPLLVFYELKIKKYPSIQFSSIKVLKAVREERKISFKNLPLFLRVLTLTLFIITIARPQEGKATSEVISEGINTVLSIDTSGSMAAIDLELYNDRVTRLEVVKNVVKEFVSKRINDPTGLVVFGTEAFTQCPLTLDTNILNQFIDNLEIGMAGDSTAIGSAIGLAVNRLKDVKGKSKVIVLLTDGSNTAGRLQPDKAAEIAAGYGIKVYTVGVGTTGRIPFVQNTFLGPQIVYGEADLDEKTLKMIADKTKGKYYRAKNFEELKQIYSDIDRLEKSEVKTKNYMEYKELFLWFLMPGVLTMLLEIILRNTRFLRIP